MRFALLLPTAFVALIACSSSDDATTPETPATVTAAWKADVYPILQNNCALSACHGASETGSGNGPPLGVHISPTDEADTYKSLVNVPSTNFKGTNLIEPGDPDNSLVMRKMDGTQAELASCPGKCGKSMPPPDDSSQQNGVLLSQSRRDKVRAWIQAGAKED